MLFSLRLLQLQPQGEMIQGWFAHVFQMGAKKNTNQPTNQPTCKTWGWTHLLCKKTRCCVCWTKCSVGKIRRRKRFYLYIVRYGLNRHQISSMQREWGLAGWRPSGVLGAAPFCLFVFFLRRKKHKNTKKKIYLKKKRPPETPTDCPPSQTKNRNSHRLPPKKIGLAGLAKGAPLWQFRETEIILV